MHMCRSAIWLILQGKPWNNAVWRAQNTDTDGGPLIVRKEKNVAQLSWHNLRTALLLLNSRD